MSNPPLETAATEQKALFDALSSVLMPMAQLAVARGVTFGELQELVKKSMVQAAAAVPHPGVAAHRRISRISTSTGIHRRDVSRLMAPAQEPRTRGRSKVSELVALWLSSKPYRSRKGLPLTLPRLGPEPSFEALANSVTRDVHFRSLLDELVRLKLARFDEATDSVTLSRGGFVPVGDDARMLDFLADNGSDHLKAAVENVLQGGGRHFEQAVFADGLSDASIESARALIGPQWAQFMAGIVPKLQEMATADAALPAADQRRIRVGVYTFDDAQPAEGAMAEAAVDGPSKKGRLKRLAKNVK
jgi:Family of unknown function (DUF6502)